MLSLRHNLIRAGPDIASDIRWVNLGVELDAPGAVAQPERVVAIKLISGKPPYTWRRTQLALLMGGLRTACR